MTLSGGCSGLILFIWEVPARFAGYNSGPAEWLARYVEDIYAANAVGVALRQPQASGA